MMEYLDKAEQTWTGGCAAVALFDGSERRLPINTARASERLTLMETTHNVTDIRGWGGNK